MGTDVCGVWIEQKKSFDDSNEVGTWECIARLSWGRDYLLFDAMDGGRHGVHDYTVVTERREPTGYSYEYDVHMNKKLRREGIWKYKYNTMQHLGLSDTADIEEEYQKFVTSENVNWNDLQLFTELIQFTEKCYPHSLSLEEAEKVQEVYIQQTREWQEAHPEYSERKLSFKIPGMKILPYMAGNPERHEGLDLAITIMKWAEANNNNNRQDKNRPTRLIYCYNY